MVEVKILGMRATVVSAKKVGKCIPVSGTKYRETVTEKFKND